MDTPIDFAYAVHTKIGDSAIGCKLMVEKQLYKQFKKWRFSKNYYI